MRNDPGSTVIVATVVEQKGKFLFVEEYTRGVLMINQPAGHLDPGESILSGAIRETLEETAWEVELTGLIGIYQWQGAIDGKPFLRFTFSAVPKQFYADRSLDEGIVQAVWLSLDEFKQASLPHRSPMVQQSVDDYCIGKRSTLDLLHYTR